MTFATIYYIAEWTIRLVMLFVIPQRRSSEAARTWLLFIFLLPIPGLIIYALFGRVYLPRKRKMMQSEVSAFIKTAQEALDKDPSLKEQMPGPFQQAVRFAQMHSDFPICMGNNVQLLSDYDDAIASLIRDIKQAKDHVHLLYYIFEDDEVGWQVADALIHAVEKGVTCRLLIDSIGSRTADVRLIPALRMAGIEVFELLPLRLLGKTAVRPDLRNHRKIAVIDGTVGYVGSQNIVRSECAPGFLNEELVARCTGPVVHQLQAVFLADYYYETDDPLTDARYFPEPLQQGSMKLQVIPSGPGYPQATYRNILVSLIYAASRSVVITTPYFVPDDSILEALRVAASRGVAVTLLLSEKHDSFLVSLAQRAFYEELLEAGVKIHLFRSKFLHAKHITIDGETAAIGSSNIDMRSFLLNSEIDLLIYDATLARELELIEENIKQQSLAITLEGWQKRSFVWRASENIARLADALL